MQTSKMSYPRISFAFLTSPSPSDVLATFQHANALRALTGEKKRNRRVVHRRWIDDGIVRLPVFYRDVFEFAFRLGDFELDGASSS